MGQDVVLQDYRQQVLYNATVTTTGSAVFDGFGAKELNLIINNTVTPTGTTPTITFMIQEVDPGDMVTVLGNSSTGTAISTITTQIVSLPMMYGGTVLVTWTVTGTTPSFTGLYASLISKVAGTTSLFSEGGVSSQGPAGTPGASAITIQGVSGGTNVNVDVTNTVNVDVTNTVTVTGTVTSNQGTPNTLANGWPVEITDGTNVLGTSGFPLYVQGTVTATNPSVGGNGATAPAFSTEVGGVYDITPVAPAAGWLEPFQIDQSGNLLTFPGNEFITGATWTSATTGGTFQYQTGTVTVGQHLGAPAVLIQLDQTTTITGGAVTIQGTYDGTNWVTVPAAQVINPSTYAQIANPYTFVPSTNQPILVLTQGFIAIRLDLTTAITGTGSVTPYWSTLARPPVDTIQGVGTAGTPEGGVVSIQGVVGGTSVPVSFTPTGDTTQTGTITTATGAVTLTSTQGDGNVSVTIGSTAWTGTVDFQGLAGDGATWVNILGYNVTTGIPTYSVTSTVTVSGNGSWTIPCSGYQKVRVVGNTWLTGTITVALEASMGAPGAIFAATGGLAAAGATAIGYPSLVAPITDNNLVGQMAFGEAYRLRVGNESLAFLDNFDGSTVNTVRWTQSNLTMSQTQAQTAFTLNANGTTTANTYSILTSTKSFQYTGEYGTECRIKAQLTPQTNSVIELGFLACATTAAPTNGVFFRITSAGVQELVINFNGTETTSTIATVLTAADYYTFVLYMYGTTARLDILSWDNSLFATTILQIPATQGALIQTGHIPVAARVYNTATPPGAAPKIILTGVTVSQLDLAGEKAWETQLGDIARFANTDPLAGTQLQQFANSSAPSTIASGSLSNTAAAYTTLGGLFAFNTPASAETDYILFAYQVPTGFDLLIWSVTIQTVLLGAQSTTTPTVLQWGLGVGSSAVSLATGAPNPPIRQAIGIQQSPKSASVGDILSPAQLIWTPRVPVVCYGGKYVHIILRVPSGNATTGQINRGIVTIDGCFQ